MDFYTNVRTFGSYIYYNGYKNGEYVQGKEKYSPSLFIPTRQESKYKDIYGNPLSKITFDTIYEYREFKKKTEDMSNFRYYGMEKQEYCWIADNFNDEIEYDYNLLKILNFDIETNSENGFPDPWITDQEILSITMSLNSKTYYVLGLKDYDSSKSEIKDKKIKYIKCKDEKELIRFFIEFINKLNVNVLTGYNIQGFDIPYVINRMKFLFEESEYNEIIKKLSPFNQVREQVLKYFDNQVIRTYDITGITSLDLMNVYKKFTYTNHESYSLNQIAFDELGKQKLDYEDYGNLRNLYKDNFTKFIDYNIMDVDLVWQINEKTNLLQLVIDMAYSAKINLDDPFFQVRMWDAIAFNYLKEHDICIPSKKDADHINFPGAHVKEPVPGMYKWIVSFDLTSLYPSIIKLLNISPETILNDNIDLNEDRIIKYLDEPKLNLNDNECYGLNNIKFDKSKLGFMPILVDKFFQKRVHFKQLSKQYKSSDKNLSIIYNIKQLCTKIMINSNYGAMSNEYFRFYDVRLASAITMTGQLIIRWIAKDLNKSINKICKTKDIDYVAAIDTDSNYLNLETIVDKFCKNKTIDETTNFLDKFSQQIIEPEIEKSINRLSNYLNAKNHCLEMKREVISNKAIWTAKKRYIMNILDNEGERYKEPKLKIMGIESVRSSTPYFCREKMKKAFKMFMESTNEEFLKFIDITKSEFYKEQIENISSPSSVKGLAKYKDHDIIYKKGTPIHVRGSLLYNDYIKKQNLDKELEYIQEGVKIKYIYLKLPNILKENVISYPNYFPRQTGLQKFIDYDTQYFKTFIKPLSKITNAIGWDIERQEKGLEDLL